MGRAIPEAWNRNAVFSFLNPAQGRAAQGALVPAAHTQTEKLFEESFNQTMDLYRNLTADVKSSQLRLENRDFDTGKVTQPNEYAMADEAYAQLAVKLADKDPAAVDPKMRASILEFFRDPDLPFAGKKDPKKWEKTLAALGKLKNNGLATK